MVLFSMQLGLFETADSNYSGMNIREESVSVVGLCHVFEIRSFPVVLVGISISCSRRTMQRSKVKVGRDSQLEFCYEIRCLS